MKGLKARGLLVAGAVACSLAVSGSFIPHSASAEFDICRTDPVIQLSNGGVLHVSTQVQASPSTVSSVAISVTLPSGVNANNIVYSGNVSETVAISHGDAGVYYTSVSAVGASNAKVTDITHLSGAGAPQSDNGTGTADVTITR